MLRIVKPLVVVTASLLALTHSAHAQTWTETIYSLTSPAIQHDQARTSFNVIRSAFYPWCSEERSHFVVTGDTTLSPPWRILFANLCANYWWEHECFEFTAPEDGTVTNRTKFTTRTGSNEFSGTNPTSSAARQLDEKIVTDLYYVFSAMETEPPEGGG